MISTPGQLSLDWGSVLELLQVNSLISKYVDELLTSELISHGQGAFVILVGLRQMRAGARQLWAALTLMSVIRLQRNLLYSTPLVLARL